MRAARTRPTAFGSVADRFESLSPELKRAARWVQANPRDVGLHSMRECARRAQVTPATMTRLAKAIGLDGFAALREPVRSALAAGEDDFTARALELQRTRGTASDWLGRINERQLANVRAAATDNRRADIEAAARAMLAAPRVWFFGLRTSHGIAFELWYIHQLIAANGALVSDVGGTLDDQLDYIAADDVVVAISIAPYTRETVAGVEALARRGVRVIALTDGALSPIARPAWRVLTVRANSTSFFHSLVGALAVAETLIAAMAAIGGDVVIRRLKTRQDRLHARGAYWETRPARRVAARDGAPAERTTYPRRSS